MDDIEVLDGVNSDALGFKREVDGGIGETLIEKFVDVSGKRDSDSALLPGVGLET